MSFKSNSISDSYTGSYTDSYTASCNINKGVIDQKECWEFFDTAYKDIKVVTNNKDSDVKTHDNSVITKQPNENDFTCSSCGFIEYNTDGVCTNCGLIFMNKIEYDSFDSTNMNDDNECDIKSYFKKCSNKYSKISKMQIWYTWSNDEKNLYKLSQYTKDLCNKLNITLHIDYICNLVNTILYKLKDNDCSKRTRVKDGIIVVCIHYTYKKNNVFVNTHFSTKTLAKSVKLDIKYITRAERSIIELMNKNKIILDKNVFFNINSPIMYIKNNSVHLNFNNGLLLNKDTLESLYKKTEILIDLCEKNELLMDHTPHSIGIGCFYYILKMSNIDVDLYQFSKEYKLSCVTVSKLFKKLVENNKINA